MDEHPRRWVAGLERDFGAAVVARGCADLIVGGDPTGTEPGRDELVTRLGGAPGAYYVEREQQHDP